MHKTSVEPEVPEDGYASRLKKCEKQGGLHACKVTLMFMQGDPYAVKAGAAATSHQSLSMWLLHVRAPAVETATAHSRVHI